MRELKITENEAGQRLDRFLTKYLNGAGRGTVYKLLRKKTFKVNGKRTTNGETFLKEGDTVTVYLSEETLAELMRPVQRRSAQSAGLNILYEDDDILVVNKPRGLLTHPDSGEYAHTLATYVQQYLAHLCTHTFRPAPVHRLDKNTSGVVVFAKTYPALKRYNALMRSREVEKVYLCVVHGILKTPGSVIGYLTKDAEKNRVRLSQSPGSGGKRCHTEYTPVRTAGPFTLVSVTLLTGRSHQIRASMQAIGHPIVGDLKYGGRAVSGVTGQLLHHRRMTVDGHVFEADAPEIESFLEGRPDA